MAQLKNTKFTIEGFKEQQSWIGKLLSPLNTLMSDLIFALNGNLTMENLSQEIKQLRFKNDSSNFPLRFQQRFNRRIAGVQIIYCYQHDSDSTVAVNSLPVWDTNAGQLSISSISGLEANKEYTIKIHIIYED